MLAQADICAGAAAAEVHFPHTNTICFALLQLQLQAGADDYVMQNAQKVALYLYLGEEKFAFEST